jgi:acyl carrier protein
MIVASAGCVTGPAPGRGAGRQAQDCAQCVAPGRLGHSAAADVIPGSVKSLDFLVPSQDRNLPVAPADNNALEREIAELLVSALNLDVAAQDVAPEAPLYGDGLGLDSIDILEVALEVSRRYGFQLRSDDEHNHLIFQSLRSLAAHVAQHRIK